MSEPDPADHQPGWPEAIGDPTSVVINATLDAIGRPALKEIYNAAIGDHVTAWRARNLANVFKAYQEATKDLPPEGRRFVAEKVGIRLIEEASLEDEPELQEIWANLFAAAVSNKKPDVTPRYVSTAKELMPIEVLFLKESYELVRKAQSPLAIVLQFREGAQWPTREGIVDIVTHLISLGIVQRIEKKIAVSDPYSVHETEVTDVTTLGEWDSVTFTKFGWDFVCAAIEGAGSTRDG